MRTHRIQSVSGALVVALLVGTACAPAPAPSSAASAASSGSPVASADADAKLIADAKADGALTLYGSPRIEAMKADADAFEKAYGIKVTYVRLAGAPLTARVDAELKATQPGADVLFTPDEVAIDKWTKSGALAKLPAVSFPNRTDYVAPVQVVGQGLVYNTSQVKPADVPKTFAQLLDQRWAGRIVIGSPKTSTAYSQTYYAMLHDPQYGNGYFEKLGALRPRMVADLATVNQLVTSGEASLGFISFPTDVANAKASDPNTPIDFAYLDITTNAYTFVAILSSGKHQKAAQLFAKWMMSPDGQKAHNGEQRASSPLGTLEGTLSPPPADKVRKVTSTDVAKEFTAIGDLFDRLFGK